MVVLIGSGVLWCVSDEASSSAFLGCFFGARYVLFGWVLQDTRFFTVVVGVFRSRSPQPQPHWFVLLGAWPSCAREVTPWTRAWGPRPVHKALVGGDRWFRRLSGVEGGPQWLYVFYTRRCRWWFVLDDNPVWLLFGCFFSFAFLVWYSKVCLLIVLILLDYVMTCI
jgi:hypothetical protein